MASSNIIDEYLPRLRSNDPTLITLDLLQSNLGPRGATLLAAALTNNSKLTTLNLCSNNITDEGMGPLATLLAINSTLTSLNLGGNSFTSTGLQPVASALCTNSTLCELFLHCNSIDVEGATLLAGVLAANSTLTTLRLGGNPIPAEGVKSFANGLASNSGLLYLYLGYNPLADGGAEHLATALAMNTTLLKLHFDGNKISQTGAQYLSAALMTNTRFEALSLNCNSIGAAGAGHFARLLATSTPLTTLALGGNGLTDDGAHFLATALATNSTLTELHLHDNEISSVGVGELASALISNHTLTRLNLGGNSVTDVGVRHLTTVLSSNSTLQEIILYSGKTITAEGARLLAHTLNTHAMLTKLDLRYNNITDEGLGHIASALMTNSSLTSLDLEKNSITDVGALRLIIALNTNFHLIHLNLVDNEISLPLLDELSMLVRSARTRKQSAEDAMNQIRLRAEQEASRLQEEVVARLKADAEEARILAETEIERLKIELKANQDALQSSENALMNAEMRAEQLKLELSNPLSQLWKESLLSNFEIPHRDIHRKEKLTGKGGFGTVYSGVYHATDVAIKVLNDVDNLEALKKEVKTWCRFRHPQIVLLFGFSTTTTPPCIVMELMHGDLYNHLHEPSDRFPSLSFSQRFRVACCVASGLSYIHAQQAVHRDIKSLNILLRGDFTAKDNMQFEAKIGDFGATRGQATIQQTRGLITHRYAAPELYQPEFKASFASDVFAFAMVMYELLTEKLPFYQLETEQQLMKALLLDKTRPDFSAISDEFPHMIQPWILLIQKTWVDEIDQRPSAQEILNQLIEITKLPAPPSSPSSRQEVDYLEGVITFTGSGVTLFELPQPSIPSSSSQIAQPAHPYRDRAIVKILNDMGFPATIQNKLFDKEGLELETIPFFDVSILERADIPEARAKLLLSKLLALHEEKKKNSAHDN